MQGTQFDAAKSMVPFEGLQNLEWSELGFAFSLGSLSYWHVDGTVLTAVSCPRVEFLLRDLQLMASSQARRIGAEVFQSVGAAPMPLALEDRPPILPCAAAPSAVVPSAFDASSSSFFKIAAAHCADPNRPFLPADHRPYIMLSPCLTALDNVDPEIVLDTSPQSGETVKYLMLQVRGLPHRIRQQNEIMKWFYGWGAKANRAVARGKIIKPCASLAFAGDCHVTLRSLL